MSVGGWASESESACESRPPLPFSSGPYVVGRALVPESLSVSVRVRGRCCRRSDCRVEVGPSWAESESV